MIPGILASWPLGDPPNPGPPTPPTPAAPASFTSAITPPGFGSTGSFKFNRIAYDQITGVWYTGGAAATLNGFYVSFDRGVTWKFRAYPYSGVGGSGQTSTHLMSHNGIMITRGATPGFSNTIFRSTDNGKTWAVNNTYGTFRFNVISNDFCGGLVGWGSVDPTIPTFTMTNVVDGNNGSYRYATSLDGGLTWSFQYSTASGTYGRDYSYPGMVTDDGQYIIIPYQSGNSPLVQGISYQTQGLTSQTSRTNLIGRYIAGRSNYLLHMALSSSIPSTYQISLSTDLGVTWSTLTPTGLPSPAGGLIFYGNGYFIIVYTTSVYSSVDGITWSLTATLPFVPSAMKYGGDRWIAIDNNGNITVCAF
jgi:hypothetical protein